MTDPTATAERLTEYAQIEGKPVLSAWMGGVDVDRGDKILNQANLPSFQFPDTAVRMFNYMWQYNTNLNSIYETPSLPTDSVEETPNRQLVASIVEHARSTGRTILTEYESKQVLAAYYIPTVNTILAPTEDEAVARAAEIGYPVVVKLNSETITHKTDIGGVQLNLRDEDAVRAAFRRIQSAVVDKAGAEHFQGVTVQPMAKLDGYELIIGSSIDPQFGPVLLFGSGGTLVEVYKDSALSLPPLNTVLARRMMEETLIYKALKGVRGRDPVDLAGLEQLLVRFSQLVVEQPWIKEIDINPLLASSERLLALDARVVLHGADVTEDKLPRPAIRPYPTQYTEAWVSKQGLDVTFRPIRPEDEPLVAKFHEGLSERTVFMRYLQAMNLNERIAHNRLSRLSYIDFDREIALVACTRNQYNSQQEIMGIGRVSKIRWTNEGEFAILVSDRYQHQGLGKAIMTRLIKVAQDEKLSRIFGFVYNENREMIRLVERLGFTLQPTDREGILLASLNL